MAVITPTPVRAGRRLERLTEALWYAASLGLLIVLWEGVSRIFQPKFLPPFTDVIVRLVDEISSGPLLSFLGSSLVNFALGFGISAVVGIVVGVLMGVFHPVEIALDPYVYAFMTAPSIVFVPIYFSLFGLSRWSIVALIVQYAMFVIIVDTTTAVKHVKPELIDMATVFGGNRYQVISKVVFRAALPLTMTGLRIGLGRSIKGMINGELLIALIGIGGAISRFGSRFDAEGVLSLIVLIVIVSLILLRGFQALDKRINGWVD